MAKIQTIPLHSGPDSKCEKTIKKVILEPLSCAGLAPSGPLWSPGAMRKFVVGPQRWSRSVATVRGPKQRRTGHLFRLCCWAVGLLGIRMEIWERAERFGARKHIV